MWHSVNYGFGKRTDVVIGEPIRLSELCSTANPDAAELDRLTAILRAAGEMYSFCKVGKTHCARAGYTV